MTDPEAPPAGAGAEGTHCEWCGAEYAAPVPGPRGPRPEPRATAPAAGDSGTRCEWCGAEYPVPDRS